MNIDKIFLEQKRYNETIRKADGDLWKSNGSLGKWTEIYLLGMISEVDEVLREINWKRHRKSNPTHNRTNIAYELADITKYVISLWELWGFTSKDMLEFVSLKSDILNIQYDQEFIPIPTDIPIVITDIDGTLGDWRSTFIEFLHSKGIDHIIEDPMISLNMDVDLSMLYTGYSDLKDEFESSGQYRNIRVYPDSKYILDLCIEHGAFIIATTARPSRQHKRIWMDTWLWAKSNDLHFDQLRIESESRIVLAHNLSRNHKVILLEDNPSLLLRGANSGIKCFARKHNYNSSLDHENIRLVNSYSELTITDLF